MLFIFTDTKNLWQRVYSRKHMVPLMYVHLYPYLGSFYKRNTCCTNAHESQHPEFVHIGTPEKLLLGFRRACICPIKGQYHLQQLQKDNQTGLFAAKIGNVYLQRFSSSFVVHSFHTPLQKDLVNSRVCCTVLYCLFIFQIIKKKKRKSWKC